MASSLLGKDKGINAERSLYLRRFEGAVALALIEGVS
jgi:hypothetical protein